MRKNSDKMRNILLCVNHRLKWDLNIDRKLFFLQGRLFSLDSRLCTLKIASATTKHFKTRYILFMLALRLPECLFLYQQQ